MADDNSSRTRSKAKAKTSTKRRSTQTKARAAVKRAPVRRVTAERVTVAERELDAAETIADRIPSVEETVVEVETETRERVRPARRASLADPTPIVARATRGVRSRDITVFLRQLIMLLEAGTPLLKALKTLETRGEHPGIRNMVTGIREYVEAGNPLWQAFARERHFTPVFVNMIKAAEASGTLTIVLERLVDFRERREIMVRRVRGAMLYPTILVLFCFAVLVLLATFVIPQFEQIFSTFDIEIEGYTAWFMGVSSLFKNYWWAMLLVVAGVVAVYYLWWQRSPVRRMMADRVKLRLPIVGPILRNSAIAEFTRTFGLMLRSGLSMMVTLDLCRNAISNRAYVDTIQDMRDSVERGEGLERPLREAERKRLLPGTVVDMLVTGEETGRLDRISEQIADRYEEEVRISVANLGEAIQPVVVLFLGIVVAMVAIALFAPLVQMIESIAGGAGL